MFYTKFGRLYRSLNKSEISQLKLWVQSPLHNKHQDIQKLYQFLFSRRKVSPLVYQKERVFKYIYSNKKYDDLRMRHLLYLALGILEKFVRYNQSILDQKSTNFLWIKDLRQRKLPKLAKQALQEAQQQLDQQAYRSDDYHLHQFHLATAKMQQIGTEHRIGTNNLEEITGSLNLFFMLNTLKYACIHLSHQNLRKTDYQIHFLPIVVETIEKGDYEKHPSLMIYYYVYKALAHPKEEIYFTQLKHYLLSYQSIFPAEEYQSLFLQALNYCIKRLNIGGERYIQEAFELYRYGLMHQVVWDGKELSPFTYKNVVALGLRLKKFDWVAHFIPNYVVYLKPESRTSYLQYNTARLHYMTGDYQACLRLLAQTDYDDVFMSMDAKVMLLKVYYEEEEYDALESLLQSVTVFLQRQNIMGYHRDHYKNVIFFIKKLLYLSSISKEKIELLKTEIQQTEPLAERPWFLKQLEKLK